MKPLDPLRNFPLIFFFEWIFSSMENIVIARKAWWNFLNKRHYYENWTINTCGLWRAANDEFFPIHLKNKLLIAPRFFLGFRNVLSIEFWLQVKLWIRSIFNAGVAMTANTCFCWCLLCWCSKYFSCFRTKRMWVRFYSKRENTGNAKNKLCTCIFYMAGRRIYILF